MSFSLNPNSLVGTKLRQQMYLRHLREVERINNREADSLKKQLKQYHSISDLHKKNKQRAMKHKIYEFNRSIEDKNLKIQYKIKHIGSDEQIKQNYANLFSTENMRKLNASLDKTEILQQLKSSPSKAEHPVKAEPAKTLHYNYRRRQRQLIEEENSKIFKAIHNQKSVLLPLIGKNRCMSELGKSKNKNKDKNIQSKQIPKQQQQKQTKKDESESIS